MVELVKRAHAEIVELADAFMADPECLAILRAYTLDEEISDPDLLSLVEFADRHPSMQRVRTPGPIGVRAAGGGPQLDMARLLNPRIAIAVARGVLAGSYQSTSDPKAEAHIKRNLIPGDRSLEGSAGAEGWLPRKLTFEEYYEVLSEVWPREDFQAALEDALRAIEEVHGDYLERQRWRPARNALDDIPYRAMLRRGWVSRPRFWHAAMTLRNKGVDIASVEEVRAILADPDRAKFMSIDFGDAS